MSNKTRIQSKQTTVAEPRFTAYQQIKAMLEMERFSRLRKKIFRAIDQALKEESHHKQYEGTFHVRAHYPNFFEDPQATAEPTVCIVLYCYVLGPGRFYEWFGETFSEAMDKAEADIDEWLGKDINVPSRQEGK